MRRVLSLAALALAMPMAAWANTIDVSNFGGTAKVNGNGSITINSTVTAFGSLFGNNLGKLSLNTGAISGASSCMGSTAASLVSPICTFVGGAGSSFVVNLAKKGIVFSGTFTQAALFLQSVTGLGKNKTYSYDLTGVFTNNAGASGTTSQLFFTTKSPLGKTGSGHVLSGNSGISVTPEPGTLALLGSGLVGIAGLVRRKVKA